MLNSVLYAGLGTLMRKVDCDQPLATAISIVGAGPSSSRAVKSTAYEREMQELPTPRGISTFSDELITDITSKTANSPGRASCHDDTALAIRTAPSAIIANT